MTTEITKTEERALAKGSLAGASPIEQMMAAVNSGVSLESLDKMMELQERWEAGQAKKAYVKAMAEFKRESITILKDREVRFKGTAYSHATLASVVSSIVPALSKHGLSHHWEVIQENGITVRCVITHEMGHSEAVSMSAPPDSSGSKNFIQQLGSTKTYLERYTLLAITGMTASDMDDDGGSYGHPQQPQPAQQASNVFPQDRFDRYFSAWAKEISSGQRTADAIIDQGKSNGTPFTKDQEEALRSAAPPAKQSSEEWLAEYDNADIQL